MNKKYQVDKEMLCYALRYALGRSSMAPSIVADNIKANLEDLGDNEIKLLIKDINNCEDYGMEMDRGLWLDLLVVMEFELVKRKDKEKA